LIQNRIPDLQARIVDPRSPILDPMPGMTLLAMLDR